MFKRILAYSLFALGFLTITFFRHYSGSLIPYPFLFWIVGLLLFWGGFLFLRYSSSSKEIAEQKELRRLVEELKENGERIKVDFSACEIKEHRYTQTSDSPDKDTNILTIGLEEQWQAVRALGSDIGSDATRVRSQSVIAFRYDNRRTGKVEEFISRAIPKDSITLSFYLDRQQQTILCIDKVKRNRYYFDLDFLNA